LSPNPPILKASGQGSKSKTLITQYGGESRFDEGQVLQLAQKRPKSFLFISPSALVPPPACATKAALSSSAAAWLPSGRRWSWKSGVVGKASDDGSGHSNELFSALADLFGV
jgi:hypothetical protein